MSRTGPATLLTSVVVAFTIAAPAAAKIVELSRTDVVGAWTFDRNGQDGTVTFSTDGTLTESLQGRTLKGRWATDHGSFIWVHEIPAGVTLSDVRALTVYRIVEAVPDTIVLREHSGVLCTLSRNPPKPVSSPQEAAEATSPFAYVKYAVTGLLALLAALRLRSHWRVGRQRSTPARPAARRAVQHVAQRAPSARLDGSIVPPSDGLIAAVLEAVKHGMDMIQATGGPLTPFMFQWKGEERTQSVLLGDSMEDGVAMGKELARDAGEEVDGCVIAWDGYVTIAGKRSDALFFQAAERGDNVSHVLVQRYSPSPEAHFRPEGNVALIRQDTPLLARKGPAASSTRDAWGPAARRGPAEVHNMIVADPTTARQSVHFTITVDRLEDAKQAIVRSFEAITSDLRSDPDFGGEVVFVVYSAVPPTAVLAAELAQVQSQLEGRIAASGLKTVKGEPLRVRIRQRKSAF